MFTTRNVVSPNLNDNEAHKKVAAAAAAAATATTVAVGATLRRPVVFLGAEHVANPCLSCSRGTSLPSLSRDTTGCRQLARALVMDGSEGERSAASNDHMLTDEDGDPVVAVFCT